MKSIRTKITLLTVGAIIVAMAAATLLGVAAIRNIGNDSADRMLILLCQAGEKNLDSYFESVEQSVEMVSSYVETDLAALDSLEPEAFGNHIDRARDIFRRTAAMTHGVLTYYYRIDPAVSDTEKGFWYVNLDGSGFVEHEATDITLYDTEDTSQLVWFTVPKATGGSIWLPPYITDNLDVRVLSYNEPVYWKGQFVGVVGIEIDYSTMAEQVDNIQLYDNGYAFINDAEGNLIYHPRIDVAGLPRDQLPQTPANLLRRDQTVRYTYDGVEKLAVRLPLQNGMRLNVSVPVSEITADWHRLVYGISAVSVLLLIVFVLLTMRLSGRITKPLGELTAVAVQVNEGDYDVKLDYDGDDEVGILTRAFRQMISYLRIYITDLRSLAYADALTSVHNKGAFDIYISRLQDRIQDPEDDLAFAVGVFDLNNLKSVNDAFGHDRGDLYLKTASALICRIFQHSPVFRTGGDEFAVLLTEDDYLRREELVRRFDEESAALCAAAQAPWERADVARGVAVYEPGADLFANDVVRRADRNMYENKRATKQARQPTAGEGN